MTLPPSFNISSLNDPNQPTRSFSHSSPESLRGVMNDLQHLNPYLNNNNNNINNNQPQISQPSLTASATKINFKT